MDVTPQRKTKNRTAENPEKESGTEPQRIQRKTKNLNRRERRERREKGRE
jgi:hypothetical protein